MDKKNAIILCKLVKRVNGEFSQKEIKQLKQTLSSYKALDNHVAIDKVLSDLVAEELNDSCSDEHKELVMAQLYRMVVKGSTTMKVDVSYTEFGLLRTWLVDNCKSTEEGAEYVWS